MDDVAMAKAGRDLTELDDAERHEPALIVLPIAFEFVLDALDERAAEFRAVGDFVGQAVVKRIELG